MFKKSQYILIISLFIVAENLYLHKLTKLKICLCVVGKNENLYIKEFINYYKKLGYNHIFLYDNNDINEEKFEDVIKDEIRKGFVTIIDFRGFRGRHISPQIEAYKDCYKKHNQEYDWLSFYDIDEYLQLIPSNLKIQSFLNNKRFNFCQNVKINWILFTSNNSLYFEDKPLEERVNIPLFNSKENVHIKSTVRGKLSKNYWLKARNSHTSIINFTSCSSSGRIVNYKSPFIAPPDFKFAFLKHHQNKSFEEYCLKIRRGRPIPNFKSYREEMKIKLFKDNKNNPEKLNILKKVFNETNFKFHEHYKYI